MKKISKIIISLAVLCTTVCAFLPSVVNAAGNCARTISVGGETICIADDSQPGGGNRSAKDLLPTIAGVFATFVGIISVVLIIYAGIMYSSAAGDPGKTQRAKQIIVGAIIGIIITISAAAIALFVGDTFEG